MPVQVGMMALVQNERQTKKPNLTKRTKKMKFTPVSRSDIPTVTRGRTADSDTQKTFNAFIESGAESAILEIGTDQKVASVNANLGSYARRNELPVFVIMRSGKIYLVADKDAPQVHRDAKAKAAAKVAAREAEAKVEGEATAEADTEVSGETAAEDFEAEWEDESAELPA